MILQKISFKEKQNMLQIGKLVIPVCRELPRKANLKILLTPHWTQWWWPLLLPGAGCC